MAISPTKKIFEQAIQKILKKYQEEGKIKNFFIKNATVMIVADMSDEEKNRFEAVFTAELYNELLPAYKSKEIANLPMTFVTPTETGLKIEF